MKFINNVFEMIKETLLRKVFLIPLLIALSSINLLPQNVQVKSLKYYRGADQTSFPIVFFGGGEGNHLTIEFDVASEHIPDMDIVFRFCDRNWKPYDNLFLANFGKNVARNVPLEFLPVTVNEAHYHFIGIFPEENVEFPFSGNWMFFVTDALDTSVVYGSGKFYVVNNIIAVHDTLKNETLEGGHYFPNELGKVFNITTNFYLSEKLFPAYVNNVTIIENRKLDYPIVIDRSFNTNTRQFYWDADRKFTFIARDIRPGNEYRQVDLRDINKFNSVNVRAQFDGLEYSRFFKEGPRDHNGGSIIDYFKNPNSIYLNVTFSIRPPDKVYGDVFLVGAFNNWELSPDYRMDYINGIFSKTIQLKRGVYDYQYVVADYQNGKIKNPDWYILEGNSWDTTDEYNIFVYYEEPTYGGYDRIIGYSRIISRR